MNGEEKSELTMCPACDEDIPRKTVILIGSPSGKHYLTEKFLEEVNKSFAEAEKAKDLYIIDIESRPIQESAFRKHRPDDCLSPLEAFLKKREKYNKRRRG